MDNNNKGKAELRKSVHRVLLAALDKADVTENKVPQNRETREKMRKPRLKKFSNLSISLTK